MTVSDLELEWRNTVMKSDEIRDLGEDSHWTSMKFGWALAKGLGPEEAFDFSLQGEV